MKKFLSGWKLWTTLSALIFFATFGLVVYAQSSTISGIFDKYKTSSIWNKLEANDWDNLMNDLNGLVDNLNKFEIPEWAVMAFEWSCPEWWTEYTHAQWRFILWAGGGYSIWSQWWESQNYLTIGQLPPHSFYTLIDKYLSWYSKIAWQDGAWPHEEPNWWINSFAHTSRTDGNDRYAIQVIQWKAKNVEANAGKTNTIWSWQAITNMPPYITLQYCIKWASNIEIPCGWSYPAWVMLWKSTSSSQKNWKWATWTEPWECEYVCAEWYIKEGNKCINYTSSEWCCTNYNNSNYGIACYNWEIDPIDTVDDKYCGLNRENIWAKPTNSKIKIFCDWSSNNSQSSIGININSHLNNPPFCPWHSRINTDTWPWIGRID